MTEKEGDLAQRKVDELKREFRYWWGTLGRDEILKLAAKRDELLLLLHEKYGYAHQEAEAEIERALRELDTRRNA
ncbi:MAG TPA: hypothetical protein VFZ14_04710 [Burkholderiales bacterium]|nr:hypothetical protein [Burkholderiales bacterium]